AAGQVHVQQHHVRPRRPDHLDRLVDIARLPDDLDAAAQLRLDPGTEHLVVVDEHDPLQVLTHALSSVGGRPPTPPGFAALMFSLSPTAPQYPPRARSGPSPSRRCAPYVR